MSPPRSLRLETPRLHLRPTRPSDAGRAFEIESNWNVTRNLRMAPFPPDAKDLADWFAGHETEWRQGTAFRFAIVRKDEMIGVVDLAEVGGGEASLGYWLDEAHWGQGFAEEAARAIVAFAFGELGLSALTSAHVVDNPASGRVLVKVGFALRGEATTHSRSRGGTIVHRLYRLERSGGEAKKGPREP